MADSTPDYQVSQQRLKMQVAAQVANIERQKLEIMEMVDRKRRNEENIAASEKAIAEMKEQLRQLAETHGLLDDQTYQRLIDTLGGPGG